MGTAEDRLLDHSYDGIQEYDNPLPSWWKWLFLVSIIYSVVYLMYFEMGRGTTIQEDYQSAKNAFFEKQAEAFADLELSEATIEQLSQDTELMSAMESKFQANCATCHGLNAEGLSGPNLTDNHWLHGGNRLDIYNTIKDGVRGKAMQAWLTKLGPAGVLTMSAYVDSLRGQNRPGPRPEEGTFVDPASLTIEPPAGE